MHHKCGRGFTLIELIASITIIAILAAVALPRMTAATPFAERGYADGIAASLRQSRAVALASGCAVQFTIDAAGYRAFQHAASGTHCAAAGAWSTPVKRGDGQSLIELQPAGVTLANLDSMNRIADQDRAVIEQTRKARRTATGLTRKLARKEHDLQALTDEAAQSTLVLEQSRSQKATYLARLTGLQQLNAASIASLQQQALAVESKARELALAASTSPAAPTQIGPGGGSMTVVATGYRNAEKELEVPASSNLGEASIRDLRLELEGS